MGAMLLLFCCYPGASRDLSFSSPHFGMERGKQMGPSFRRDDGKINSKQSNDKSIAPKGAPTKGQRGIV